MNLKPLILCTLALAACSSPAPPSVVELSGSDRDALRRAANSTGIAHDADGNLAVIFAGRWIAKAIPGATCEAWTGRGTRAGSGSAVDSALCSAQTGTTIVYCSAPDNAAPECKTVASWGAQPQPAPAPPAKP